MANGDDYYPFEVEQTPDGPTLAGWDPNRTLPKWEADRVGTILMVTTELGDPMGGQGVMEILGLLWTPPVGTEIEVGWPNRDLVVTGQRYRIDPDRLWSFVHVHDPVERVHDPSDPT